MLQTEIVSAGYRRSDNENSESACKTLKPNTPMLKLRKTASSMVFIRKLMKRIPSFTCRKPEDFESNLNLNDPLDLEKMKQILLKKKEARNPQEIRIIAKSFESIDLFKEIKIGVEPLLYQRLFKELIYEEFPVNHFIFRAKDPPDKLYIVLSGEVCILAVKEAKIQNSFEKLNPKLNSIEDTTFMGYKILNIMKKFQSFGEIALKNNANRTASAACKTNCELVSIDYKIFRIVLKSFFESQSSERLEHLRMVPMFKSIPTHYLEGIILHMKEMKFKKGNTIYKEGEILEYVYLIKEGEIQASKTIDLKLLRNKISEEKCYSQEKLFEFLSQNDLETFKNLNSALARKLFLLNKKSHVLFTMTKGECFGEKAMLLENRRDDFSMVCKSSESIIYMLPFHKIFENFSHLNEVFSLQFMNTHAKIKKQKHFLANVMQTESLILQTFETKEKKESESKETQAILKELIKSDLSVRNLRPENQAYELKNKAKYHYTTRYLPSNLLLKRDLNEEKTEESDFQEFTLEKNLIKMFNPQSVNLRKLNSESHEFIKENKDLSVRLLRPFSEIVKNLENATKKNMPNIILYKSLKVKDKTAEKVYKYCSDTLKVGNKSVRKIKKEKSRFIKNVEASSKKKEFEKNMVYNFCNIDKFI